MTWWSAHTHSQYSTLDAMSDIPRLVAKVAKNNQPALGITDHGNMAATVKLYKEARKHDITPFPGVEAYIIDPGFSGDLADSGKADRYHLGLLALDLKGYRALIQFVSKTHTRPRFNRFPRATIEDLAGLGKEAGAHIALTTGCFFGYTQQSIALGDIRRAERFVKTLATWFPHTFVEFQNHDITHDSEFGDDADVEVFHDDDMVIELDAIAKRLGLPVLATQDAHYCDQREKVAHALMKRMVYGGSEDEFPGDSFHLASGEWVAEHYTEGQWSDALEGSEHLLSLNKLSIPPLDKFEAHVPAMSKRPNRELRRLLNDALDQYIEDMEWEEYRDDYIERLYGDPEGEYNVITDLGMANYFLFVKDGVEWCRHNNIAIEARGSANGSLVCFLLGITQIDPLVWGTLFPRFLSRDRIKPPDIDIDIEDVARPRVIEYRSSNFETLQIGTFAELGAREADQRGSVMATYTQYLRRQIIEKYKDRERRRAERCAEGDCRCKDECAGPKAVMGKAEERGKAHYRTNLGWIQSIDDVRKYNPRDADGLIQMARMKSVRKSYGVHASGVLVSGADMKISDWVPSMLVASSDTSVTQFDMDDVEEFGMLKEDWLGQKSLRIMRRCQELMGLDTPTDFGWIPEDDPAACKLLREGRVDNGIFHFEGYTKAKGGREMGIKSTADAVLATALYMPGAIESGQKDLYIKRRKSAAERKAITYLHPIFETALGDTYGAVIFQEQPLTILRELGMSIESINKMFKVIKDSGKGAVERNMARLQELRIEFDRLFLAAGLPKEDLDEAWFLTTGFMNYGFNRAHASGYGLRSYRFAYLKAHYPLEFMTSLLEANAGDKKEREYVREARRIGIRILPPDVNISGAHWTIDRKRGAIRRGLSSIAGVGPAAAEELAANAPYRDVDDLIERVNGKAVTGGKNWVTEGKLIGTLGKLRDAGALDELVRQW